MSGCEHRHLKDLGALLLAAGEAVVEMPGGERAIDVQQLDRVLELGAELLDLDRLLALGVDRHAQEVGDRHAGDRDRVLEGEEQACLGAVVRLGLGDVLAFEGDRALGDLVGGVAEQGVGHRRLAGAVGPHQGVDLAPADVEVDAPEDLALLDAHMQVSDLQVGHGLLVSLGSEAVRFAGSRRPASGGVMSRSASVVSRSVPMIDIRTRVHSSLVGQTWSRSDSRAHTIDPSADCEMHSIGAIEPSSASTTSAIVICDAGRASM